MIKGFDFDGVIHFHSLGCGVRPGPDDVIITGRSFENTEYVIGVLESYEIRNPVFFNPLPKKDNNRVLSGRHKANTLNQLRADGIEVAIFFEDDPIQKEQIEEHASWVKIVHLVHELTEK